MEKVKVIINSSPRSGHAWLQWLLLHSLEQKNVHIGDISNDDFIIRTNAPVILLGRFDGMVQTTILREPKDIIPSIITKTFGGFGNTIASSIAMPHEYNELPPKDVFVRDQIDVYHRWASGIQMNIENLIPFTFDQVTKDPNFTVETILSNFDRKYNAPNNLDLETLKEKAAMQISMHDKGNIGYNNAVPVDKKPDIYYELLDLTLADPRIQELDILYHQVSKSVVDRQERILNA